MDKELFLKESFKNKFGEKLGPRRKVLNVLINLTSGSNISFSGDSLNFYDDKIELSIKKENEDEEVINGKIVIYDSRRYYYLESNNLAKTSLGFVYDNGNCAIKYKSLYDDFSVERDVNFKLYKEDNGILYMSNELFNCPLSMCYPSLKEQIEDNKSVSKNIGLLISDDMYNLIDFKIKMEQRETIKKSLEQRIYNRFHDVYSYEDISDNAKIRNEIAIIYDLVNHPYISLDSINFQGKEGFNKYESKNLANTIEVNILRTDGDRTIPGKFLICGGKYVFYCDDTDEKDIYNNRIDIIPNTNDKGYIFEYKCKDNAGVAYIYNIYSDYELQASGKILSREYISLKSIDSNSVPSQENAKCIISMNKYTSYIADKSVYSLIGELVSGRYIDIIKDYSGNYVKKLK